VLFMIPKAPCLANPLVDDFDTSELGKFLQTALK
jgi:hypothetical protein